jgi:hypothetical protein
MYSNKVYLKYKELVNKALEETFKEISNKHELNSIDSQEIEYRSRDGFIPYTNSGYEIQGYSNLNFVTDNYIEAVYDKLTELQETIYKDIKTSPENAGKTYSEIEDIYIDELNSHSVLFNLKIFFYEAGNYHNTFKDIDSVYISGTINWESPYHRDERGYDVEFHQEFSIKDTFKQDLINALTEIKNKML